MSRRLRVFAFAVLVASTGCSQSTSTPPSESSAPGPSIASSAAPSETDVIEPVAVTFVGTLPEGFELADGVPVPTDGSLVFEVHQGMSVMAADCALGPEPGVGTSATEIIDALEAREGLDVTDRGTVEIGELSGESLDYSANEDGPLTCPDEAGGFVPLFGQFVNDAWLFAGAGPTEDHRMIAVDLPNGGTALILMYAVEPDVLADHLDAAMQVVEGLEFGAAGG